jgi:tRNA(Ile)-lysidine synthetase-like protein
MVETFLTDWFSHPEWWFDKNPENDAYISRTYGHLLDEFCILDTENMIGKIIVWDQLPRHMFREEPANHIIEFYLQKSICIIKANITNHEVLDKFTIPEFVFFLLPLRHTKIPEHIFFVMNIAWRLLHRHNTQEDERLLKRFIKATYKHFPTENQLHSIKQNSVSFNTAGYNYFNILDFAPLEPIKECPSSFIGNISELCKNGVLISLSGGVDSMVCSYSIRKLFPNRRLCAVMINYNNRDSSVEEVNFVTHICHNLDIELYVRDIHEIKRKLCMEDGLREVYETYTRNVRYATYKTVWREIMGYRDMPCVVLGHNLDDAFENCMTNMTYKAKYCNLKGMENVSVLDGVRFLRPLLQVPKDEIIQYAKEHNIPFLTNSTPPWSQRGKIRNNIMPVLNEWHPLCIDGILKMSDVMQELYSMFQKNVQEWYKRFEKQDTIPVHEIEDSILFWKELFESHYAIFISTGCLNNFKDRLSRFKQNFETFQRNEKIRVDVGRHVTVHITKVSNSNCCIIIEKKIEISKKEAYKYQNA